MKKCNGCKRNLNDLNFTRKNKIHARCNDCSLKSSYRKNICETCGINAIFNNEGLNWGRYCKSHKEINMVNVMGKTCIYNGCKSNPSFNIEGENRGLYCSIHKEPGMINVKCKTCIYNGCKSVSNYNKEGEIKPLYCAVHKEINMIDVRNRTCIYPGCKIRPIFNKEGETRGIYCSIHKEYGMVNVKHKICIYYGCKLLATFNKEGETKPLYCSLHKEHDMINVTDRTCIHTGCKTLPTYNKEGETKPLYCSLHKEPGMINVKDRTCIHTGCKTLPTYNKEGETKPLYCSLHKEPGMINVRDRTCIHTGCKTLCNFGYCGQASSHCAQHKLDYMIIKPKRTCIGNDEEDCKEISIYGNKEPIHCEEHKLQHEICFLVKKCENCGRDKELLNYKNLCSICCDKPFYEESKRLNKLKESIMVRYLREHIKEGNEILADRIIDNTCNLYRPDILYDCDTHIVIIECDEFQHRNYNWESCSLNKSLKHMEEKRMYEIMIAYGLPSIFIRWNPDTFKVKGEICKKYNNNKRLELLIKWVKYCFKKNDFQGVIYKNLFYDEFREEDITFNTISDKELLD